MKNIKLYEKLKEVKGKKVALIAGGILTGALIIAGCTTQVVVDPNTGEVTVTEQQPTEPEVIETSDPVEEVEPVEEEIDIDALMPQFPILNEDGSLYHTEKVKCEVIDAKIAELESLAENDYERDTMVMFMLSVNSPLYSEKLFEDLSLMYYVDEDDKASIYYARDWGNEKVPFSTYFIDEREAKEAAKFEQMMAVLSSEETPEEIKTEIINRIEKQVSDCDQNYTADERLDLPFGFWYEILSKTYNFDLKYTSMVSCIMSPSDASYVDFEEVKKHADGYITVMETYDDETKKAVYDIIEASREEWDNEVDKEFTK